jgi:hypothetical protein
MRSTLVAFALLAASALPAAAGDAPVLVELFTSQGCSSCPQADALAGELSARDDVVVLSFHVNYWDYIGWSDPFASEETTGRQYAYAHALGERNVYTPQMIIGGALPVVGNDKRAVLRAIRRAGRQSDNAPSIHFSRRGEDLLVELGAAEPPRDPANVLLVRYTDRHETDVPLGQNAGRRLVNHHVVRDMKVVGQWDGRSSEIVLTGESFAAGVPGRDGCALFLQAADHGRIFAAVDFDPATVR